MKTFWRLTAVLLKGNGPVLLGGNQGKKRKKRRIGTLILMAYLAVYLTMIMGMSTLGLHRVLSAVGLQDLLINLFISAGTTMVFFFGILYVISIFYYAGDVQRLLPLPLKAEQIIGAKLLVTAIWEYVFLAVLVLTPLLVYGFLERLRFSYYVFLLLTTLLLPVIPLCLASILVMLLMRFTPFARNKDRFNLISGLLALLLAFGFVFGIQSMTALGQGDLVQLIQTGAAAMAQLTTTLFPGTAFAVGSLIGLTVFDRLSQTAILLLLDALVVAVTLFVARLVYFSGVVDIQVSPARGRRLGDKDLARLARSSNSLWAACLKDIRIMVRTPVFFMNNILMNFLWPLFLVVPVVLGAGDGDWRQTLVLARLFFSDRDGSAMPVVLSVAFGLVCFVSATNGITASALSREGTFFYLLKILPVPWHRQMHAKLLAGLIFSFFGALVPLLLLFVLVQPPAWLVLSLLSLLPGALLLANTTGLLFDLYWPKLQRDNEQQAVKQNLNIVFGLLTSLFLAVILILPTVLLAGSLLVSLALLSGGSLVFSGLLLAWLRHKLPVRMAQIEP